VCKGVLFSNLLLVQSCMCINIHLAILFSQNPQQETEESLEPGDTQPKLSFQKSEQETLFKK